MVHIRVIPKCEFERIEAADGLDMHTRVGLLADMCRANTLAAVKRAGSGHLGTSFSAMEIVAWLYWQEMNTIEVGIEDPNRDIFFSSKGHDVPGLYSVLHARGVLSQEMLMKLRRFGGLDGHPHVSIDGIEANTGSLGMGISKGKGMAVAKQLQKRGGRIFVMTGDGELQEGQIYEALQSAVYQRITNLRVIVDHNKVQSDRLVSEIGDLGDVEAKFTAFGWHVERCDGHDLTALEKALRAFETVDDKPKVLVADTVKGKGVSFMEHPVALKDGEGLYKWHSGAPDDESFEAGYKEILGRINGRLEGLSLPPVVLDEVPEEVKRPSSVTQDYVSVAYGQALVEIGAEREDLVVLCADLTHDCKLEGFEAKYPDRFIENGIAEQDMVSVAGGLALQGLLPCVNSFSTFLAARGNEQIYTNGGERTKIIYGCHYAGVIPAGPGLSHQSIRDISLFGALPNFEILEPCNLVESRLIVRYCINEAPENCVIRLVIGPSPRRIELPEDYELVRGRGITLTKGSDAVLFSYGPVMLHEALVAAETLAAIGFSLKVVNMPWLNRVDPDWLADTIHGISAVYVLEDHSSVGGLGDCLLREMAARRLLQDRSYQCIGIDEYPAWGNPPEVLRHHGVDGAAIAEKIQAAFCDTTIDRLKR